MMTTETALCAGAPWLIRNTQNMFSFRTVLCDSPWAKFYVATLIQPDPECLIARSGYLCRRKVARGGGMGQREWLRRWEASTRTGRATVSITDVGSACELTTVMSRDGF